MNITFKLTGQSSSLALSRLSGQLEGIVDQVLENWTGSWAKKFRSRLLGQDFNFEAITEKWAKRKGRGSTLLWEDNYVWSIQSRKLDQSRFEISPSDELSTGTKYGSKPISMNHLGIILELGNPENNTPPRPHFRVIADEMTSDTEDLLNEISVKVRAFLSGAKL